MSDFIAVVDTETTGLDPKKDRLLEVSWALVHLDSARILEVHSRLFRDDTNPAEKVNGIPIGLLGTSQYATRAPVDIGRGVAAIAAHNAAFDQQWHPVDSAAPWVCTQDDWTWPRAGTSRTLVGLALAHGVGVTSAHRAFTDVLTLCALLERVHETIPLREQLAQAMKPRETFIAHVSFAEKDLAKEAGFRWDGTSKTWSRRMSADEASALPFRATPAKPSTVERR